MIAAGFCILAGPVTAQDSSVSIGQPGQFSADLAAGAGAQDCSEFMAIYYGLDNEAKMIVRNEAAEWAQGYMSGRNRERALYGGQPQDLSQYDPNYLTNYIVTECRWRPSSEIYQILDSEYQNPQFRAS